MVRLYTFLISHFSEKARFALDLAGVAHEERALLPGPHIPTIRKIAPLTTVPVLVHGTTVVQGSSAVLDYAEARLGASSAPAVDPERAARARALETLADDAFGRGVQTIFYDSLLRDRATMIDLWSQGAPRATRAFYAVGFPFLASRIRAMYGVTPERVVAAKDVFRRALDETDRALEGRRYLDGDAPGRTDVSLAALLAPAFSPPEHVVRWPAVLPHELASFVEEIGRRPTIEHGRRMYREHRRTRNPGN